MLRNSQEWFIIAYQLVNYHGFQILGYDGENPTKTLQKVSQSAKIMMDRWKIEFSKPEEGEEEEEGDPIPCNIINNYFSIGVVSITWMGWTTVLNFCVIVYTYVGIGLLKMHFVKWTSRKMLIKIIQEDTSYKFRKKNTYDHPAIALVCLHRDFNPTQTTCINKWYDVVFLRTRLLACFSLLFHLIKVFAYFMDRNFVNMNGNLGIILCLSYLELRRIVFPYLKFWESSEIFFDLSFFVLGCFHSS